MPSTPIVVLEIDDNTPRELPPYTMDVSAWSFQHDFNLATRTAAETFRKIHVAFGGSKFRGFPDNVPPSTWELLDRLAESDQVTWLTGGGVGRRANFHTDRGI